LFDNSNIKKSDLESLTGEEKFALDNYLSKVINTETNVNESPILPFKPYVIKRKTDEEKWDSLKAKSKTVIEKVKSEKGFNYTIKDIYDEMNKENKLDLPDEKVMIVKEKDVLDLGKHKLTFYLMPMVHWPESMATYDITDKILFSNDAFGSFGALDGAVFDDEVNTDFFTDEMRRYYSNIVGKFGAPVNAVLKKLSSLEISCICPSHGLIWRKYIKELIERYQKWANMEPTKEGVVIVYGSMYGHTAEMAEYLGRELGNRGIKDVIIFDSSKTDHSYIFSTIWKYKGLMLGSCAHNNDVYPKMEPLLHKLQNYGLKNRYLGIFGNMMWSGGGVKKIKEFADSLPGLEQIGEPIEIKGHVTPVERDRLIELANLMADKLIADRE